MKNSDKIIVMYIGIQGIRSEDIEEFIYKVSKKISPSISTGEIIAIPTQSSDTRIECINPKYITNTELISEHTKMMKKLLDELRNQSSQLKDKYNE